MRNILRLSFSATAFPWAAGILLSGVWAGVYAWAGSCGIGLTHDSEQYIALASRLRAEGLAFFPPAAEDLIWPPLFPALLALVQPAGEAGIRALQGGSTLLAFWLCWLAAYRAGLRGMWMLWLMLGTVVQVPLWANALFLWSEPVFTCLLTGYVVVCVEWMKKPTRWHGPTAALLALLLFGQRYAALLLIAFCWMGIGWWAAGSTWRTSAWADAAKRLALPLLHLFPLGMCVLGWLTLISPESQANWDQAYGGVLFWLQRGGDYAGWWVWQWIPLRPEGMWGLAALAVGATVLWPLFRRLAPEPLTAALGWMAVLYVFSVLAMGGVGLKGTPEGDAERYLSTALLPALFGLARIGQHFSGHIGRRGRALLLLLAFLWLLYPLARSGQNTWRWHKRFCEQAEQEAATGQGYAGVLYPAQSFQQHDF